MTPKQVTMTQIEFGKAWKAMQAIGGVKNYTRESWRASLKIRAGAVDMRGNPLSSKGMNNNHVDEFLKLCKSYSDPANIDAQIQIDEQPTLRALQACAPLLDLIKMLEHQREAYIAGIYRNTQRKRTREEGVPEIPLHQMPDEDLGNVLAALTHTVEHKLGVDHNHPRSGRGWRSRNDHRVGHSKTGANAPSQKASRQNLPQRQQAPVADLFDPTDPF